METSAVIRNPQSRPQTIVSVVQHPPPLPHKDRYFKIPSQKPSRLRLHDDIPIKSILHLYCQTSLAKPYTQIPKGSKYHYSRYLVGIWAPKAYTKLLLGPFGIRLRPPLRDGKCHSEALNFESFCNTTARIPQFGEPPPPPPLPSAQSPNLKPETLKSQSSPKETSVLAPG